MSPFLKKWLSVYDEEAAVFGWTALLLLLLSAATVILNNYAETAFLKRFGVKHLPVIYMLNSALTFILMGLLFWNLANDLFNTRQAKRLFPLIAAGGAIGTILGSAITPVLAGLFSLDNQPLDDPQA